MTEELNELKKENIAYREKIIEYENLITELGSTIKSLNNLLNHYKLIAEIYYFQLTKKDNDE